MPQFVRSRVADPGKMRKPTQPTQPEFLTIPDVAELLKLGERTVYQLAREGRIGGAAKVGGQWRFDRAALLQWLRAGGDQGAER